MPTATEIASIPLKAEANFEDVNSHAGKVWASVIDTIANQDGYQRLFYAREIEDSKNINLVVDWDSVESHQKFKESAVYGPFLENLGQIQDGQIRVVDVEFNPAPPTDAIANSLAPVTEIIFAFLATKDEGYATRSAEFAETLQSKADACKGQMTGWAQEQVESNGHKVWAYVSMLAWESVEKHAAFRETVDFKDNVSRVREGSIGLAVAHAAFKQK